ncbi:MAG: cell surface protein SprA, partial [Candidatus Zixiibacteriota bacterium]
NSVYDLEEREDIGLDGRTNDEEREWFSNVLFALDQNDPAGDDFPFVDEIITPLPILRDGAVVASNPDLEKLRKVNGYENNVFDPDLTNVDTEDLDGNRQVSLTNDYFSFKVALDPTATENNFFVPGSLNENGWVTIRIPVRDERSLDTAVGNPDWTNIRFARIWLDSLVDPTRLEIATMDLVSSNWDDTLLIPDSSVSSPSEFELSVINTAEDAIYTPPEGVTGSVDQLNNITEPEQSLRMDYKGLVAGDTALIFRLQSAANYTGYRELRMFVHGDAKSAQVNGPTADQVFFFFRIGTDTRNFYEFRTILDSGWAATNEVVMDFNELTALKDLALKDELVDAEGRLDSGAKDPRFRVFGAPTLRSVRYLSAGLSNASDTDLVSGITGSVWLDELRLSEVRRDVGTAGRVSLSGNLGDFITSYSFNVSFQDAFYRNIAQATRGGSTNSLGSGRSDLSYQFNLNMQADKFLPPSLAANIPVRFSFSRSVSTPLLVTAGNSDIVLPEGRRREERTIQESRGFSIRESFRRNTRNPIFTVLLNKLRTNFDYTRTKSSSPTVPSSLGENFSAGANYDPQTIPRVPGIPLFFMFSKVPALKKLSTARLNLAPNSFSFRSSFRRNLTVTVQDRLGTITTTRWFDNLSSTYTLSVQSDLRNPDWVNVSLSDFRLGKVTRMQQNFSTDYSPTLFRFLTHKFTASSSYTENRQQNVVDLEASPSDSALEPLNVGQNLRVSVSG